MYEEQSCPFPIKPLCLLIIAALLLGLGMGFLFYQRYGHIEVSQSTEQTSAPLEDVQ